MATLFIWQIRGLWGFSFAPAIERGESSSKSVDLAGMPHSVPKISSKVNTPQDLRTDHERENCKVSTIAVQLLTVGQNNHNANSNSHPRPLFVCCDANIYIVVVVESEEFSAPPVKERIKKGQ